MLEMGKPCGLIAWVSSFHASGPLSALVVTHTWPPVGTVEISGPSPFVPAYITCEKPFESFSPPAPMERTRFVSLPVHAPDPRVSKSELSKEKLPPAAAPRQMRQVPKMSSPEFCGSSKNGK